MGVYNNLLIAFLLSKRAKFTVQSPLHIKRSMGLVRSKTDKVDAYRIAEFASRNADKLKLYERPREIIQDLQQMLALRRRLLETKTRLTQPITVALRFNLRSYLSIIREGSKHTIDAVKKDIAAVEANILKLIKADLRLSRLYEVLVSVERIGFVIAANLIVITNEFKRFETANELCCFIRLTPFEHSSGTKTQRPRISHYGHKELKALLSLAALGTIRKTGGQRDYYERKVKAGKHPFVVLNAIKNKIVHQLFCCVKEDRLFLKHYETGSPVKMRVD